MALHALQPMIGQGVLAAPRRYLALFLPRWATDCLKRAEPALQTSTRPLALWEKQRSSMRLVAVDERAAAEGLIVGMPLADAKGLVPHLAVREIDRATTARIFADFADWHSNASPLVSVLTDAGEQVLRDASSLEHRALAHAFRLGIERRFEPRRQPQPVGVAHLYWGHTGDSLGIEAR